MPFLLLDDATDEATRRLQDFGQQQLTNLTQAGQAAGQAIQQANQPPLQQAPQQVQGGLQDITARLQDFGQQQVQSAVQTIQPLQAAQQQVQQKQQDAQDALGRLQTFGSDQITNLTQPPPQQPKTTDQLGGGDLQQPAVQPGGDLQAYARQAAQKAGIDPDIFTAQIQQESGFNPSAKSPAGAIGVAQFMPGTAQGMGVDPTDPYAALDAAARLDAQNLAKYGGDYSKALAAYNAGPQAVDQYGGVPPFQETQDYVKTILGGARQAVGGAVSGIKQAISGQPNTSGDVFPVVGYQGQVADHWGSVKGGSDIMAPRGTPVVAMRGGKVLESGWNDVGGNSVLIQGDDGNQYYYAHFDGAPSVKVGDSVPSGTPLGAVGNTGDAQGGPTHLHIGIGPSILLGADKYGGTGGDYDAVGLLRSTLQGAAQRQAPDTASGPASLAPPTPQAIAAGVQGGLDQLGAAKDRAVQGFQDISNFIPDVPSVVGGAASALGTAAHQGPLRTAQTNLNVGDLDAQQLAQRAAADVNFQRAQDEAERVTGARPGFRSPGLEDLVPLGGTLPPAGLGTSSPGDVLEQQINQEIAARNPARDVPVAGPVSTWLGQQVLNPTNLALMAGGLEPGRAALEFAQEPSVARFLTDETGALNLGGGGESSLPAAVRLSVAELADVLRQYPQNVQRGLRDFVETQTQAGRPGAEINDTLRQWVAENPLTAVAETAAPRAAAAAAAPETTIPTATLPPLEALTSGVSTPPPAAPPAGPPPSSGPTAGPGILAAPGEAVSRLGSVVASALSPTENLPVDTRGVITNYANMVGRQSDAARVIAENEMRTAGARLDIPAVAEQVQQRIGELRDEAARVLVRNLQTQGKAAPVGNAPREFRTVTDDPNAYLANYAFSPDVVGPIRAVTDLSMVASNPLGNAVLKTIGTAKGTLFSLSNFHTLTEGLNAAFTSPQTLANYLRAFASDSFAQGVRGSMADTFDAAAQAGVTGLAEHARPEDVGTQVADALRRRLVAGSVSGLGGAAAGYTETKLTGGTEEEARANAVKGGIAGLTLAGVPLPGGRGTLPEILQSALWDRAVPLAKATAWDALQKGGLDPQAAAQVVNERFGGLNYAAMGRHATLLDAQRLSLMASDWNEATVRQLGSAIFGGDGSGVTRAFLATTIASMMGVTEATNVALSGHSTLQNQPGHQFEVEMPNPSGGYLHFGLLPGNVQAYLNLANTVVGDPAKRATAPTNFIVNRLSGPASTGIDLALAAAGRPPFQVARAGPIALGENVSPIGVSQVLQSTLQGGLNPVVAAGLAAAGLNPRYSSPRGGFVAPQTERMAPPSRTGTTGSGGARAPVPKR